MNLLDVALREIEPVRSPKISLKLKDFPPKKKKIWKKNIKKKKSKLELRKRTWWPKISLELKDFPPNKKMLKSLPQIYLLLLLFVVKSKAKRWVKGVWESWKIEKEAIWVLKTNVSVLGVLSYFVDSVLRGSSFFFFFS